LNKGWIILFGWVQLTIILHVLWNGPIPPQNARSLVYQATIPLGGNTLFQGLLRSIIGFQIDDLHFNHVMSHQLKEKEKDVNM
jgi:hypothetical protein